MSGEVAERLATVRASISEACQKAGRPDDVTLVAVSKTVPAEAVLDAYRAGQRVFGENRVQEGVSKQQAVTAGGAEVEWHLIGHLQTNKIKAALGAFSLLQSIDSLRLAERVDQQAASAGRLLPVLFEVNVAAESTKGGFACDGLMQSLPQLLALRNILPLGLMTVAPLVASGDEVRPVFRTLREMRDRIREDFELPAFVELSMGMSNDYFEAIAEGATIVRVGRAIFGDRPVQSRVGNG